MGNHISCVHIRPEAPAETIKLIKSDGLVKIYDKPIHASQLMVEFPKHLVCRSDSFYIGQKIQALSEDEQLQLGYNYFLLPKQCFQSVLSFVTIASFVNPSQAQRPSSSSTLSSSTRDSRYSLLKKAATCKPFDIQKSPSGCLRIRVSDEFISQLIEESNMKETSDEEDYPKPTSRVCNTPQLQKDYTQLVGTRARHWKPKLETITETEKKMRKLSSFGMIMETEKKMRKLSSFGMKRRKNSQSKLIGTSKAHRSSDHHHHGTSIKSASKVKIKFKIKSRKCGAV